MGPVPVGGSGGELTRSVTIDVIRSTGSVGRAMGPGPMRSSTAPMPGSSGEIGCAGSCV